MPSGSKDAPKDTTGSTLGRWPHTLRMVTWDNSVEAYIGAARAIHYDINGDPLLYHDALATPEVELWKEAMVDEIASLDKHKVWELVDLPPGRTPIKNRWCYVTKRDTDNRPIHFKA